MEAKELYYHSLRIAGVRIDCGFEFPETASKFGQYCRPAGPSDRALTMPDWMFKEIEPIIGEKSPQTEYSAFSFIVSTELLDHDRCLIHAAAIRHGDKAYLIVGPSGTGKSTQAKALLTDHPGEFSVISGDRPALELLPEGGVMVHPSPWNGKEGWCGADAAPLAGIILLERGEENSIKKITTREAVLPLYIAFFQINELEETIRQVAGFETALLQAAPVWKLESRSVPEATERLYNEVFRRTP